MARVFESAVINAPIETVWRILRDFNSHADWHPAIAESRIENDLPADSVGAVRAFSLQDGGRLREQLIRLDDRAHELSYCLIEAPLPLYGYVATIRLKPLTDSGQTLWIWESRFSPPPDQSDELTALVSRDIYRAGFRALEAHLSGGNDGVSGHRVVRSPVAMVPAASPSDNPDKPWQSRATIAAPTASPASPVAASGGTLETMAVMMLRHGGPEVLELQTVRVAAPAPGEVRIRQSHVGVNFIDIYCRTGYFNLVTPPGIPGMEAAGTIESVGPGVDHLRAGDRVAYACAPTGAYTGLRTMDAELVMPLPPEMPEPIAAAGLLKGVAAAFLLHDIARVEPGQTIVVHAAAGGVGQLLTQWASALGAHVIGTVSIHEKAALARASGAREVIVGRGQNFVETVREITHGRGAEVIFDAVGQDSFSASLEALAIRGHLISFGQASGPVGSHDIGALAGKSATISRPNYGHYTDTRPLMSLQMDRLVHAIQSGMVSIAEPLVMPLSDVRRAHQMLESGQSTGSIVLATS